MAKYATFQFDRDEVNRAGRILVNAGAPDAPELIWALDVINSWRVAHSYPLNAIAMNLYNRAQRRDVHAVVARRLKRLPSIEGKLRRFATMRLRQIQDIGGCRAVMKDILDVERLLADYDESDARNQHSHRRIGYKNYIQDPKPDGYRSVHLVYAYKGHNERTVAYDNQTIEVQVRSQLQHAWATAVETVDTFTGQAIKSGSADADWARFFALMGSVIAEREHTPGVPGTPADRRDLFGEVTALAQHLDVARKLQAWRAAIRYTEQSMEPAANIYLLVLDAKHERLFIRGFTDVGPASEAYRLAEQESEANAVLVTVNSVAALPVAYPNYYIHTDLFLEALRSATHAAKAMS